MRIRASGTVLATVFAPCRLPLLAMAAGMAGAAEMAIAVPAASNACHRSFSFLRGLIAWSAAGRRAGAEVEADGLAVGAEELDDPDALDHPAVGGDDLELIGVGEVAAASRGEGAAEPVGADDPVDVAGRAYRRDVVRSIGPG